MKKLHLICCLSPLILLLAACGSQVSNGRIAYTNKIQAEPYHRDRGIPIYRDVQFISPLGTGASTLPHPTPDASGDKRNVELPIWSPDGKKLMVIAKNTLYTTNPDGTGTTKISEYRTIIPDAKDFAWSPDSQRLAFALHGGISVAEQNGSRKVLVADSKLRRVDNSLVGWSADSQSVLFYQQLPQDKIALYRIAIPKTLPETPEGLADSDRKQLASWSSQEFNGCRMHPNGQQVACLIGETVKLVAIDNGNQSDFLAGKIKVLPVWSLDGERIAFTTQASGAPEILWTMASHGWQSPQKIAEAPDFAIWQWSPDSQKLLFAPAETRVEGFDVGQGLFTINADGKNLQTIVPSDRVGNTIRFVSWQPLPRK